MVSVLTIKLLVMLILSFVMRVCMRECDSIQILSLEPVLQQVWETILGLVLIFCDV